MGDRKSLSHRWMKEERIVDTAAEEFDFFCPLKQKIHLMYITFMLQ